MTRGRCGSLFHIRMTFAFTTPRRFSRRTRSDKMSNSMKSMRVAKGMSRSFCFVLLLFTCGVLSAQNQEHHVRNIVLVHGAWADGSGWKGVYDILVKDGYNVS